MQELKTYRDLFQAILDGHEVEYWSDNQCKWIPPICGWYFDTHVLDEDIVSSKPQFRIKPTKPSIDWSQVSDEFNYLARNSSEYALLFQCEPILGDFSWFVNKGQFSGAKSHKSYKSGTCDWKDSLVKRPEGI